MFMLSHLRVEVLGKVLHGCKVGAGGPHDAHGHHVARHQECCECTRATKCPTVSRKSALQHVGCMEKGYVCMLGKKGNPQSQGLLCVPAENARSFEKCRYVPECTARRALAACFVSTTAEMLRSEDPWEMASTLMLARPKALKNRPDTPEAECMLSPTVQRKKKMNTHARVCARKSDMPLL